MTLLDRLVLILVRFVYGLIDEARRRAGIARQADDAATQATQGNPEDAEAFIREHGGKK